MRACNTGRIHSVESFGTVDGPGIRFVVFFQGCPMRCLYCHNPDTWSAEGGTEMTVDELLAAYQRNKGFYRQGGITATGGDDTDSYVSFRLESPYFARSRHLTLHITGSEWLDKSRERVHLDLDTGKADFLPEGAAFAGAQHHADGWILEFRVKERREDFTHQVFFMTFEDSGGTEHEMGSQSRFTDYEGEDDSYFIERLPLPDYHESEVWLRPTYSHAAVEETPITIPIK